MPQLFEETTINGMTLANRFVRSATGSGAASETGSPTPQLTQLMVQLAEGGVGLIISGALSITKNGYSFPGQVGIYTDPQVQSLHDMVTTVHRAGGIVAAQLVHGGVHCIEALTGEEPMGPSALAPSMGKGGPFDGCQGMTQFDIDIIIAAFAQAAKYAQEAGFDSVQLHGCHGSLLSQFLSGVYNKRTDEYGGSVENRARIVLEAYNAVRHQVGKAYPVTIKLNTTDYHDQGVTGDTFLKVATMLEQAGMDAIELSGGLLWNMYEYDDINRTFARIVKEEAYYRDIAKQAKQHLTIPTILTGGFRSYEVAEQIVSDSIADYVGLCRPLIREPDLVNRWKSSNTAKSACVSDNACMFAIMNRQVLHCIHLKSKTRSRARA